MNKRRSRATGYLTLAGLASGALASAPPAAAQEEPPAPPPPIDGTRIIVTEETPPPPVMGVFEDGSALPVDREDERWVREHYGLDGSDAAVAAAAGGRTELLGVPITEAEEAAVRRVLANQDLLMEADAALTALPGFAAVHFDAPSGGTIQVSVTGDGASDDEIRRIVGDAPLEVRRVEHSAAELEAIHDQLVERLRAQGSLMAGVRVDRVATNPQTNRVELVIDPSEAERAGDVLKEVEALPADVRVEPRVTFDQTSTWGDKDSIGGQRIDSNGVLFCSTAFPVQASNGDQGLLTAAHCGGLSSYWQTMPPDNLNIGFMTRRSYASDTDAAVLGWRPVLPKVHYIMNSDHAAVVGFGWSNGIATGIRVYLTAPRSGALYWQDSGVDDFDTTVILGDSDEKDHFQTGWLCARGGDSGSPVFTMHSSGRAVAGGILAGAPEDIDCGDGEMVAWGRTSRALDRLNVSLVAQSP